MSIPLFDQANQVIGARSAWEQKQRLYYQMRHDGLRRRNKPFPAAADLHFPLIDMTIRKAKPFWESQATASERLVSFVALQEQQQEITTAAADFCDFELKQNCNFEPELVRAIDSMLLRGRGVLKVTVDPFDDYRIMCESVDPVFILMADGADDFEDADWWVHVMHLTVAGYKRNRRYEQSDDTIAAIRGSKDLDIASSFLADKEQIEGVTYSRNAEKILLWEHYVKTMGGWTVNTYSPQNPKKLVRKPFGVPYKFRGRPSQPFYSFKTEIKDKGWYSPRGVAQLSASMEVYACKLWNEKADSMTFLNRPVFTAESAIPNTANIRWNPGEFIPGNIKSVPMAQPAFSFDQEIAFARGTAEQQNMLPDFGITQAGQPGSGGSPRTATENNRIANLQTVGTESNGRIFRSDLAKVYRHIWGLILQYKRSSLTYYAGKELKVLPEQALHDAYLIMPDGAPDQWNKQQRVQRAMQRLQVFGSSPNVNLDVLVRDALAADDPKLALEAFIPTNIKAASESEDEAMEIVIMEQGFPAAVKPNEDHAARIHTLLTFLQTQTMKGAPVDPVAQQRIQQHLAVHFMYLRKQQPQLAKQILQQVAAAERQPSPGPGGQQSPGGQQPMPGPGGPPPMPGPMGNPS